MDLIGTEIVGFLTHGLKYNVNDITSCYFYMKAKHMTLHSGFNAR